MNLPRLTLFVLGSLFLLRHDFWWWDSTQRWLGLPIGLAWHLLICVAVAIAMALLAKIDPQESE